jgi:hypothetical protein
MISITRCSGKRKLGRQQKDQWLPENQGETQNNEQVELRGF